MLFVSILETLTSRGMKGGVVIVEPDNKIGGSILAVAFPPSLNNTLVIAIDLDVRVMVHSLNDGMCEELESDGLYPADVAFISFPVGEEMPCMPEVSNNNANTQMSWCQSRHWGQI